MNVWLCYTLHSSYCVCGTAGTFSIICDWNIYFLKPLSISSRIYKVTYPYVHLFTCCFARLQFGLFALERPLKDRLFSLCPQSIFHHSIELFFFFKQYLLIHFCWHSGLCALCCSYCWLHGANTSSSFRLCFWLFSDPFFSPSTAKDNAASQSLLFNLVSSTCLVSFIYMY